ncbi:hypothetical protein EHZ19_24935 [Paraburkholderia bannensis]|uniref:hypothetical protein n=1 Tax=Paraburkholderia tropica TaxID=92647 RepID=UPI000F534472|nr:MULTISPECIES: hypothetical protein [Paraburkholderia]RQM45219.1 hypothetical protein EHZ19_24935 [Paraburkholderia bannensis]CAG9208285.1 conserved hypothetical protein [Paraburkholderia tropica]
MLKLFVGDVMKSPGKLLALCLVVYLATMSFFVGLFLFLVAIHWVRKQIMLKAKAFEAAEAEAARERANEVREQALKADAKPAEQVAPVSVAVAQVTPVRQYARSAVVIPMKKTGTHD